MTHISKAAVLGGGVIGAAWAARFIQNGIDTVLYDPAPDAEARIQAVFDNADRAFAKLTLAPPPRRGAFRLVRSAADAVDGADFVQEAAPERLDLKQDLFAEIDALLPPDVVIASSTSGLKPTDMQARMAHPERLVVGHPFNPVYLLPLVEIVGGDRTGQAAIDTARAFYTVIGMKPLVIRKEIEAFVADRLMEALWREALWLVHDDIATAGEIDDAIRYGCGLRWAQMGTFQVFNIAGGEAGMRHFMAQFGPALKWPWTKLMDTPEMDDALIEKIAAQCEEQSDGLSIRELERIRDDNLVAIMQALRQNRWGAGETLADYERALFDAGHGGETAEPDLSQPLKLYDGSVRPDWTDYNNHMSESRYLECFANATDAMMRFIGADADYIASGGSYFTAETHIVHTAEIAGLDPFYATTQVLSADPKRMHLFHRLFHARDDRLLATGEHMLLHVDLNERCVAPAADVVYGRLKEVADAHAALPRPDQAGRHIGAPRS